MMILASVDNLSKSGWRPAETFKDFLFRNRQKQIDSSIIEEKKREVQVFTQIYIFRKNVKNFYFNVTNL